MLSMATGAVPSRVRTTAVCTGFHAYDCPRYKIVVVGGGGMFFSSAIGVCGDLTHFVMAILRRRQVGAHYPVHSISFRA